MPATYHRSVFINAPFDHTHWDLFHAMVSTVMDCGFEPRCALESDDGSQVRIEKLFGIVEQCPLGIHDISYTKAQRGSKPQSMTVKTIAWNKSQ